MSFTKKIEGVYVNSVGLACGKKEKEGPLGRYFKTFFDDDKCGEKTYESGEMKLMKEAYKNCLNQARLDSNAIDLVIAGDLNNQLACSSKVMAGIEVPFLGVYGACATSVLGLGIASLLVKSHECNNIIVGATSSYATSERQFRYPQEYGLPKKESVTTTVTGSAMALVTSLESKIKITSITFGDVCSPVTYDTSDMGTPMALSAYKTISDHLNNNGETFGDYDLILTGDLSSVGSDMLKKLFEADDKILFNHQDCGLLIYDIAKQNVMSGGSGTACCPLVTYSYVFDKLIRGAYKRVLVVATGALFDPVYVWQKKNIPTIAHAIVFERNDKDGISI